MAITFQTKHIFMSTTSVIPELPDCAIAASHIVWCSGHSSIKAALDAVASWARDTGYDAVVGLRIEAVPEVSGSQFASGAGGTSTTISYLAYGTALSWEKPAVATVVTINGRAVPATK